MKIAVPSYQVRSGYMPVCWSGTSLFEILDPPLISMIKHLSVYIHARKTIPLTPIHSFTKQILYQQSSS